MSNADERKVKKATAAFDRMEQVRAQTREAVKVWDVYTHTIAPPAPEYRIPVDVRYDLLEPEFMDGMAKIMGVGAKKYGENNWKSGLTGANSGLNHALKHINEYMRGEINDYGDDETHLEQAAVNLMFEAFHRRKAKKEANRVRKNAA